ncbi:MAG: GNAT family N-acetyltransferase [Thermodesulfobacteriota bacterium]
MNTNNITTSVLDKFDDPTIGPEIWGGLMSEGNTDTINLPWHWQSMWWQAFGRGKLLLVKAERNGRLIALAPLFTDGGMVYNICPEDHLDFVGDISDPEVLDSLLNAARDQVTNFEGFLFYFIPDTSKTGKLLEHAAARLNLKFIHEGSLPSPIIEIARKPEKAFASAQKKKILQYERILQRDGSLEVYHLRKPEEIIPYLHEFFKQHIARRAATSHPSIFTNPAQRTYYERITNFIGPTGLLRFAVVIWNDKPIAFHYGLSYKERYLYGIPTFSIDHTRYSPGMVLLRHVLLDAIEEGTHIFDFGIGDEAYKYRFATDVIQLENWGLYNKSH